MFFEENRRFDVEVLAMKMAEEEENLGVSKEVVENMDMLWRKNNIWGQVYVRK
jgi:hypothetical protein